MEEDLHQTQSDKSLISKIYKELKKLDSKILNNQIKKMWYWTEQRILNWVQKTLKVMLNLLSNQENANQNHFEIPSNTCQNS